MRLLSTLRIDALILCVVSAASYLCAQSPGLPPRATPGDYQAQVQAGTVTIAAEFKGHSVTSPEKTLTTEEYVVVELGLFGPPEARIKLSIEDFSLRVNGKKAPLPSQPYGLVAKTLKDPDWVPPESAAPKSKGSFGGSGGGAGQNDLPPSPPKVPIELQRAMAQRVQKASLPEGDRPLPQAGLIFFQYRGKSESIRSIELLYAGPAGTATLALQP
jgi:hypothetical protein